MVKTFLVCAFDGNFPLITEQTVIRAAAYRPCRGSSDAAQPQGIIIVW